MRQLSRNLIATTALVAAGFTSASAADLGVRAPLIKGPIVAPVSHWGGFYVSGSAGGTWTRSDFTQSSNTPFTDTETFTVVCPACGSEGATLSGVQATTRNGLDTLGQSSTGSDKGAV